MSETKLIGREVHRFKVTPEYPRHGEGSFLRLKDGRILLAYSRFCGGGHDDSPCNLVASWSSDEGETWTEPVEIVRADEFGAKNIMSVSLIEMRNGDVGMFACVKVGFSDNQMWLFRSNDGGATWYARHECTLPDRRAYYVLNNDRVIRLQSGRLIIPLAFHRGGFGNHGEALYWDSRAYCFFLLSDDDGETWREAKDGVYPPFTNTRSGLQEPGVVELNNGVVQAYFRTDHMYHYEAFSFDGGDTWTIAQPSRFTGPCSPLLIRNIDGALYAAWTPTPDYNGRAITRTPMAIAKCEDGVWTEPFLMDNRTDEYYCYPAIIKVADGILVSYMVCIPNHGIELAVKKIPL